MSRGYAEVIQSGQKRAYADTTRHVRVTFGDDPDEAEVRERLLAMHVGFTDFTYPPEGRDATAEDFFATRLDWLKKTGEGVWEFHTTSAFTD